MTKPTTDSTLASRSSGIGGGARVGGVRGTGAGDDHPRETTVKYCLHCDWEVRAADGYSRRERSTAALEHFSATGHTVDSL